MTCDYCIFSHGSITKHCKDCSKVNSETRDKLHSDETKLRLEIKRLTETFGIRVSEDLSQFIKQECPTLYKQILQEIVYDINTIRKEE